MRPGGHRPTNLPERKINGLPTPQNLRFCQDGQFSALWNVNDSTVQMTAPDMLIGFQAQFLTLSGVYTMEMNRFDSFTHYRNWAPKHSPSVHQRKLLRKYLYFVLSQWPEEDVQGPFPSQTGNPSTSSQPIINQIPASGMNIKTATLRQILVDHGQNAAPGQHVSPDHPPRTNNLLTVNSPHSLHPGSIYAAPPPPPQSIQVPQSGPQAIHLNLPAQMPLPGPPQTVPVSQPITTPSVVIPRQGKPIVITPQDPRKRSDSPVPPNGPQPKPLTTGSPCTLTTIDEQPIKMRIKKRASDAVNNQWEIEEIPAKSRNVTRSRRHLPPPPKSPERENNLIMDISSETKEESPLTDNGQN